MGRSNAKEHSRSHTVAIAFSDGEPGDFFAVKVEGDSHYGTPIFTTMGGLSSCPGETGTTKVDDRVTIAKIEYHCDPSSFVPSADCRDNLPGSTVAVGVIVQNLSPAWTVVTYQLMLGGDYASADPWFDGMYHYTDERCGREGASNGLNVEVAGDPVDCHEYVDIPVKVVSECEFNGDTYQNDPYQYLTELDTSGAPSSSSGLAVVHPVWVPDDLAFDEDTLPGGLAGDEATFSVHWIAATWAPTPTEPPTTAAHFSEAAAGTRSPSENPNVPTLSTAPSLAPTTPSPTKAPSRSMVAFNLVLEVGYEAVGATAAAYCAAYEAVGLDAIQEALVASYVEADANATVDAAPPPRPNATVHVDVDLTIGIVLYATDVIDRDAGETFGTVEAELNDMMAAKVASGAWDADQAAHAAGALAATDLLSPAPSAGAAANGTGGRRGLPGGRQPGDLAGSTAEDVAAGRARPCRALTFGTTVPAAAKCPFHGETDALKARAGSQPPAAPSPKKHHEARHHASKKGSHEHRKKSAEPPMPPHKTNPFTVARAGRHLQDAAGEAVPLSSAATSSGQVYYSNTKTGETTWTKPSGYHGPEAIAPGGKAKWLEAHDPKSGLPFYTNAATGETTWDRPKGVEIKPAPAKARGRGPLRGHEEVRHNAERPASSR
ncbi:calcium ion binding protein [Aureococcus anophagefferens]|nr:calcium ion binding protein [Aureococcus anophagefferens]